MKTVFPFTVTNAVQGFKILPSILFSASGCSWQQTHSLCFGMISHRSQVHQNVPSNRLFTSSFSLSSGVGTCSGSKRYG